MYVSYLQLLGVPFLQLHWIVVFIEVGLGFTVKSLKNSMKFFFTSDLLSNRTRFDIGYLHSHIWLNNCDTCAELFSMIDTSTISNQHV